MTLAPDQLPRILAGLVPQGPLSLSGHHEVHGPLPELGSRRSRRNGHLVGDPVLAQIEMSGLRGMGGGSFPTATKLAAVAAQPGDRVVVINATEGEPLSHKDRLLLSRLPHLVLDGAIVAATLIGAREIVVAIDVRTKTLAQISERAISERPDLGGRRGISATLMQTPSGYLVGQETALINVLNGGQAKPTTTPPYPFERGLGRQPTLVSNAETYAHLGLIARYGADWYRSIGTGTAPGSRLISVSGAVAEPGVIEVAGGTDLATLLRVAGGPSQPIQAILFGGYGGTWMPVDGLDLALDEHFLRQYGLTLGAGIVFALPEAACPVAEVASVARYLDRESAGQCGPCVNGLGALADALEDLCTEGDRYGTYGRIERWCAMVTGRGACSHPDGVARFVSSALRVFRHEFDAHAHSGRCERCGLSTWMPVKLRREPIEPRRDWALA